MKKTFKILAMFFVLTGYCQDVRTTLYTYTDTNAFIKDGFNIGFGLDYQRQTGFNSFNVFVFPKLRGVNYTEITGSQGLNLHFDQEHKRLFAKIKGGLVFRGGNTYPLIGFESGLEIYNRNGFFIGGTLGIDHRADGKVWGTNEPNYWSYYGQIKIGLTL